MKTKILVSTLLLSSCFVACNNEVVEIANENINVPSTEIVGADLVSEGLTIKAELGGVESRANARGWENDDRVGLAWYNVSGKVSNNMWAQGSIYDTQAREGWEGVVYDGMAVETPTDKKIYNNILFNYANGDFTTKANVYQGAYIAYFPHQYMSQVAPLSFNVQQEQTDDATVEQYNKGLQISAQDFISAEKVEAADGVLESKFYLYPVVNTLKVAATPTAKIKANALLKEMTITNVTVSQNKALFNVETDEINPWTVPAIQYKEDGVTVDEDATKAKMDEWATSLGLAEGVKSLSTNVAEELALTLANERIVRLFTLPTEAMEGTAGKIVVKVESNGIAVGSFEISKADTNEGNKKAIAKLNALTTEEGYVASDNRAYTLQEIMRNEAGDPVAQKLSIELTAANFKPVTSISTLAEWNEIVEVIDAMYAIDKTIAVPTFTLKKDIEFVDGEIKVPACGLMVNTGTKKMIVASENIVWPNNLVMATGKTLNIEVKKDASLFVNGTKKDAATLAATEIVNKGEIYANAYASISTEEDLALNNAEGRVIVEYGSYVYPSAGNEGDIVFVVEDATKIANVNTLIDNDGVLGSANVNTLIVRTVLDLNAPATKTTAGDRYYEGNDATSLTENIKDINIELEGGSLVHVIKTGANTTVANVKAVSGENTINDVVVAGNIDVEEGATLNVNGILTPTAKTYEVVDIVNDGTLNINVKTLNVNNISNEGYIAVATGCKVVHAGEFVQVEGTYKGTIKAADEPVVTTPDYAALEAAVKSIFAAWQTSWNNTPSLTAEWDLANVVKTITKITEAEMEAGEKSKVKFYNALKDWYDAKGLTFVEPKDFTADYIGAFNVNNEGNENDLTF